MIKRITCSHWDEGTKEREMSVEGIIKIINKSGLYIFANSNFTTEQVDCESKCLALAIKNELKTF